MKFCMLCVCVCSLDGGDGADAVVAKRADVVISRSKMSSVSVVSSSSSLYWSVHGLLLYQGKNKKYAKIRCFRRPPSRQETSTKFCIRGPLPDIFLGFEFQKDRLKMWELGGGRNFGLSIDKVHRLYNSLLLPHKPWFICTVQCAAIKNPQFLRYFFAQFSGIISDTMCRHYCRCSEVAQFSIKSKIFFQLRRQINQTATKLQAYFAYLTRLKCRITPVVCR